MCSCWEHRGVHLGIILESAGTLSEAFQSHHPKFLQTAFLTFWSKLPTANFRSRLGPDSLNCCWKGERGRNASGKNLQREKGARRDGFQSEMEPKLSKMVQSGSKSEPKWSQNGANASQDAPKWSPGAKVLIFNWFWSSFESQLGPSLIPNPWKWRQKACRKSILKKYRKMIEQIS